MIGQIRMTESNLDQEDIDFADDIIIWVNSTVNSDVYRKKLKLTLK